MKRFSGLSIYNPSQHHLHTHGHESALLIDKLCSQFQVIDSSDHMKV